MTKNQGHKTYLRARHRTLRCSYKKYQQKQTSHCSRMANYKRMLDMSLITPETCLMVDYMINCLAEGPILQLFTKTLFFYNTYCDP